jgi:TIR domain
VLSIQQTRGKQAKGKSMRKGQRYRLTKSIAEKLAKDYFEISDIDLYFQAFGVQTSHDYNRFGDAWSAYAIGTMADTSDDNLLEMAEDLGIPTLGISGSTSSSPKFWPDKKDFRLFISHISLHKDKATRLRSCLAAHHIKGFVAHEDIKPTSLWQIEIERALHTMDAFLAIHTEGFSKSVWTQQEIGFAVARGVKIISFKMGEDPTGFIGKSQALPRLNRTAELIAEEVRDILSTDELTQQRMAEVVAAYKVSEVPR